MWVWRESPAPTIANVSSLQQLSEPVLLVSVTHRVKRDKGETVDLAVRAGLPGLPLLAEGGPGIAGRGLAGVEDGEAEGERAGRAEEPARRPLRPPAAGEEGEGEAGAGEHPGGGPQRSGDPLAQRAPHRLDLSRLALDHRHGGEVHHLAQDAEALADLHLPGGEVHGEEPEERGQP